MIAYDFIVKKKISINEIQNAIVELLNIPIKNFSIVNDLDQLTENSDRQLICQVIEIEGSYSIIVNLYILDESMDELMINDFIIDLCKMFDTEALVPGESPDVLEMILVKGSGERKVVFLNADNLDNDIYTLQEEN